MCARSEPQEKGARRLRHAQGPQCPEVRPVGHPVCGELVVLAVAGQEEPPPDRRSARSAAQPKAARTGCRSRRGAGPRPGSRSRCRRGCRPAPRRRRWSSRRRGGRSHDELASAGARSPFDSPLLAPEASLLAPEGFLAPPSDVLPDVSSDFVACSRVASPSKRWWRGCRGAAVGRVEPVALEGDGRGAEDLRTTPSPGAMQAAGLCSEAAAGQLVRLSSAKDCWTSKRTSPGSAAIFVGGHGLPRLGSPARARWDDS